MQNEKPGIETRFLKHTHLRENIDDYANVLKDIGSSGYIKDPIEIHEKIASMLRSHLK